MANKLSAKFRVVGIDPHHLSGSWVHALLEANSDILDVVGIEANPPKDVHLQVNAPAALDFFKLGETFVVEFSKPEPIVPETLETSPSNETKAPEAPGLFKRLISSLGGSGDQAVAPAPVQTTDPLTPPPLSKSAS